MSAIVDPVAPSLQKRLWWPAIIAGAIVALAAQVMLGVIGGAFGVSGANAGSNALGVISAVWLILTPLVALFAGGMCAVFLARPRERRFASFYGVMVWAVGLLAAGVIASVVASTSFAGLLTGAGIEHAGYMNAPRAERQHIQNQKNSTDANKIQDKASDYGTGGAWALSFDLVFSLLTCIGGAALMHGRIFENREDDRRVSRGNSSGIDTGLPVERHVITSETEYRPDLH